MKNVKNIQSIHTKGSRTPLVGHVRIGTIGWLKTTKNEVRQCRLEEFTFENYLTPRCVWKVAQMGNVEGLGWNSIDGLGVIYETREGAEHGSANVHFHNSKFGTNTTFNVVELLKERYGDFTNKVIDFKGCWFDSLTINTILMRKDGTLPIYRDTPFYITADKDGVKVIIPSVEFGDAFLTKEAALATYKPLDVFTFDDEEESETYEIKAEAVFSRSFTIKAKSYEEAVEKAKAKLRSENFTAADSNGTQFI